MKINQKKKKIKENLKAKISRHVASIYPGCIADFEGKPGKVSPRVRLLGFRVIDKESGKARSNLIWINPEYPGPVSKQWVQEEVEQSNH